MYSRFLHGKDLSVMWLLAALGTTFCFGINNTLFKWSTTKKLSKTGVQFFFYLIAFLLVMVYGVTFHAFHVSALTAVIGGLIGIFNANGNLEMSKAFERGPASITSTLIATNSIVVVLASALFFPETVPLLHWFGILLMVLAAMVVQYQPDRRKQIHYKSWLFHCAFSLLSIGTVGVLLKLAAALHLNFLDILLTMYGEGLLFLALLMSKQLPQIFHYTGEMKLASVVGFLSIIGYSCYLFALKTGPASIVFPVISLNCLVVMFAGLLLFKERLKIYQWIGTVAALFGLILTKI